MNQPDGYIIFEINGKVCLLKKFLYGLKQSPRQWHRKFDEFMLKIHFERCSYDGYVYMKKHANKVLSYLLLYVDDMLRASDSKKEMQKLKDILNNEFEMKEC